MMRRLGLVLCLVLGGCTGLESYEYRALERAQETTDGLTARALWWLCEGASIGSFQRLSEAVQDEVVGLCEARPSVWRRPPQGVE